MLVPVYMCIGFLEAGKTSFIQECLEDEYFNEGEGTLILLCEEGSEELDKEKFAAQNVFIEVLEEPENVSKKKLKALSRKYDVERVMVEYNGMWPVKKFIDSMPDLWFMGQIMFFADANTFMNYNANMRNLVADKLKVCDVAVFNRFKDELNKKEFHDIVRTFNRKTSILYDFSKDRVEPDEFEDPLPYDMDAPVIEVEDDFYAVWYANVNEETANYCKKTVRIKGRVIVDKKIPEGDFIFGRHVMTCCAEDIEFCAVACHTKGEMSNEIKKLKKGQWVWITGTVDEGVHKLYSGEVGPIITVTKIEPADKPKDEVATYY